MIIPVKHTHTHRLTLWDTAELEKPYPHLYPFFFLPRITQREPFLTHPLCIFRTNNALVPKHRDDQATQGHRAWMWDNTLQTSLWSISSQTHRAHISHQEKSNTWRNEKAKGDEKKQWSMQFPYNEENNFRSFDRKLQINPKLQEWTLPHLV